MGGGGEKGGPYVWGFVGQIRSVKLAEYCNRLFRLILDNFEVWNGEQSRDLSARGNGNPGRN